MEADTEGEDQEDIAEEVDTNNRGTAMEGITREEATTNALSPLTTVRSSRRVRLLNE